MTMAAQLNVLFEQLVDIESEVERLYRIYAERFTATKELWTSLAGEEAHHASWLRELQLEIIEDAIPVDIERFSSEDIDDTRTKVQNALAESTVVTERQALETAQGLEDNIIEQKFYSVVPETIPPMVRVYHVLDEATRRHRERIEEAMLVVLQPVE